MAMCRAYVQVTIPVLVKGNDMEKIIDHAQEWVSGIIRTAGITEFSCSTRDIKIIEKGDYDYGKPFLSVSA